MRTAAVRDLHAHHPGRFLTDERTPCPHLWEHNPHFTPIRDDEPGSGCDRVRKPQILESKSCDGSHRTVLRFHFPKIHAPQHLSSQYNPRHHHEPNPPISHHDSSRDPRHPASPVPEVRRGRREANSADLRGGTFPVSSIEVIPLGQTKTYYDGVGRVVQMDRSTLGVEIVSSTSYSYTHCPTTTPPSKPGSRFGGHNP